MLRMIAALVKGESSIFLNTPFEEFVVTLESNTEVVIRRNNIDKPHPVEPHAALELAIRNQDGRTVETHRPREVPKEVLDQVDKFVPGPYGRSGGGWIDEERRKYSLHEILEMFPNAAAGLPPDYNFGFFDELTGLQVFFIKSDRLNVVPSVGAGRGLSREYNRLSFGTGAGEDPVQTVERFSLDLVEKIRSVLGDYAKHSQARDRSFPERLVRFVRDGQKAYPERKILEMMTELESKRLRLVSLGLLDQEVGLRNLTEDDVRGAPQALSIYVDDMRQKLTVFDYIAQRIGSLMDIINSRFQYKRLSIDRRRGFRVISSQKDRIALSDLSSGEQNELVVLYELLFRAPQEGLVLIDEPEISLHPAWQSRFLTDLIEILKLSNAYAVIATHSPVIIGERWDLTTQLEGPDVKSEHLSDPGN
jgi:hypothetical protein